MSVMRRAVLGVAPLAVSACAGVGQSQPPASKEPVTIQWSIPLDNKPFEEAAAKATASFQAKFPHVTISPQVQVNTPNGPNWREKNFAAWMAGSGPDVTRAVENQMVDWVRQGIFSGLDALLKRDAKQVNTSDYPDGLLNTWKTAEKGFCVLPLSFRGMVLYYNKQVFQRAGIAFPDNTWDWSKWSQTLVRIARPDDGQLGWYLQINANRLQPYIRQNGGNIVDQADPKKPAFHQPAGIEAVQWVHDRMHKDRTLAKQAEVLAGGLNEPRSLATGRLAMLSDWMAPFITIVQSNPELIGQIDVAVLPKGPARRHTLAAAEGWGMWQQSKALDASWEFMKYLQGDEWYELQASMVASQPPRKSWVEKFVPAVKKGFPLLADKNLNAFVDPVREGYMTTPQFFSKNDSEASTLIGDAYTQSILRNERAVADALRAAADRINVLNA